MTATYYKTHEVLGPQGEHVAALINRAGTLTADEAVRLGGAWDAAVSAAWVAAWDAAEALAIRDVIPVAHYDTLTLPWRRTIGRIHPDDPDVTQ